MEIEEIKKVRLDPEDVVVIRLPTGQPNAEIERILARIKEIFKMLKLKNKVLLLEDLDLEIWEKKK